MVRTNIEKVDGNAALFNLNLSKAFDSVDHGFLEVIQSAAGFRLQLDSPSLCVLQSHG